MVNATKVAIAPDHLAVAVAIDEGNAALSIQRELYEAGWLSGKRDRRRQSIYATAYPLGSPQLQSWVVHLTMFVLGSLDKQ